MWKKNVVYKIVVGILALVIGVGALGLSAFAENVMPTPVPTTETEPTEAPATPSPTASPEATAIPDSNENSNNSENTDENVNSGEKTDENVVGNVIENVIEISKEKNEDETNTGENEIATVDMNTSVITLDTNGGTLDNKTTVEATTGSTYGFLAGEGKHFSSSADNEYMGYAEYDFGSAITVSTKVSFDKFTNDSYDLPQEWFDNCEGGGFGLRYDQDYDTFGFGVHTNGAWHINYYKRGTIKTNEAHWITGVYDANTDKMELYVDGKKQQAYKSMQPNVKKSITVSPVGLVDAGNPSKDGKGYDKNKQFYGTVYKGGIWAKALSQTEIDDMVKNDYINSEALINKDYIPQISNYPFEGWYEDLNDSNSKITANTKITKSTTLHAKWKGLSTITIDPNGGTYKGNSNKTSEAVASGTVYELNEIPTRPGYTFQGWKLSGGGY